MKILSSLLLRLRARARARLPRAIFSPRHPARLVVRLDDAEGALGASVDDWQAQLAAVLAWSGPTPAWVIGAADHPALVEVARFLARLECPVQVRTTVEGLERPRMAALLDAGLEGLWLPWASVEGEEGARARRAVEQAVATRNHLRVRARVGVEIPAGAPEAARIEELARRVGVKDILHAPPWTDAAGAPGRARQRGDRPCSVWAQLEVRPGSVGSCPFAPRIAVGAPTEAGVAAAWGALEGARAAIQRCDRCCAHPILQPADLHRRA